MDEGGNEMRRDSQHVDARYACCTRMKRADPLAQFRLIRLTAEEIIFLNCHLSLRVASFISPNRQPASPCWGIPLYPPLSAVGVLFIRIPRVSVSVILLQIPGNPTSWLNPLMVTRSRSRPTNQL